MRFKIPWGKPLPWGTRIGLLGISLVVLLAACQEGPSTSLAPVAQTEAGAPRITRVEPGSFGPGGGETATLVGQGLLSTHTVWIGGTAVSDVEATPDGTRLTFTTPPAPAGSSVDVGVGTVKDGEVVQRVVLVGGYTTSGLSSTHVATIGVLLAVLALLGTPLFLIIAAVTCLGLYLETQSKSDLGFFYSGESAGAGATLFVSWLAPMGDSPLFIAIPLFTFAGTLMSESKAPTRLINLCRAAFGWLPGGMAIVTLVTCCFFTAFTGASGVTIIALGGLLFPVLLREKYPERFSLGLLTTGGSLGLLLAPSLPVIVYGLVARVEVGRLFVAAGIPMLILVLVLCILSAIVAIAANVPRHRAFLPMLAKASGAFALAAVVAGVPYWIGWISGSTANLLLGVALLGIGAALDEEFRTACREALWELPLPFLILGGIYNGFMTAAEASAVTAFYVIVTTVFVYKDVKPRELFTVVRRTAVLVGAILLIMGTALGFTDWLTLEEIPQKILALMQERIDDQLTFLIMLNIFLLIVGCMMDIFSATLVVVPLIAPVAREFGVDPYHLAVIFLVNLEIGYSTPPVGINLFIASLRFRRPVFALYRASVLFIVVLLFCLLAITYVPAFSLGLFDEMPAMEVYGEDEKPAASELRIKAGESRKLRVEMSVDGVTLLVAKERRTETMQALRAEEEKLGLSFDELEDAANVALQALTTARAKGGDVDAAKAAYAQALEKKSPLDPAAKALDRARKLVDEINTLERKVRWRSRLDGTERSGATFDTERLGPGTHVLTATAEDKRRHLVQRVFTVVVGGEGEGGSDGQADGASDGESDGESDGGADWGDEGDWGEGGGDSDGADDWGDEGDWGEDGGEKKPDGESDGGDDWGDASDWGEDGGEKKPDEKPKKDEKKADDGADDWGSDEDWGE